MAKKGLLGLAIGAGLVVFLAVLFFYYPRGPQVEPTKPEVTQEMPYRTAPEFTGKPPSVDAPSPPAKESPTSPLAKVDQQTSGIPAPTAAKPAEPQAKPEPLPEEQYGLLMGRYRTYKEASKVMEKLQQEGQTAFIRHDGRQRRPYSVWAGPFSSQEETKVAATSIKKQLKVSPKQKKLQIPVPK